MGSYDEEIYAKAYAMDLAPRRTPKGWSIRCPRHGDQHHSALVFNNDGWAVCFAGCGRWNFMGSNHKPSPENYEVKSRETRDRVVVDYRDYWLSLDLLDEGIKGMSADHLNSLGWRKLPSNNDLRLPAGIFIPAFNTTKTQIPFAQVRHNEGDRRFSFPSRVKPILFGFENLELFKTYIPFTEGNSDRVVLALAGIPSVAIPSASSGEILKQLGQWANEHGKVLVACSDNDMAGDKLLTALDDVAPYIDARPKLKDYGEVYEKHGIEAVRKDLKWLVEKDIKQEVLELMMS